MMRFTFPDKTWFLADDATDFLEQYASLNCAVLSEATAARGRDLLILRMFPFLGGNEHLTADTWLWQNRLTHPSVTDERLVALLVEHGDLSVEEVNVVENKSALQGHGPRFVLWD